MMAKYLYYFLNSPLDARNDFVNKIILNGH